MTECDSGSDMNIRDTVSIERRWELFAKLILVQDKKSYLEIYSALTRGGGSGSWTLVCTNQSIELRKKLQAKYRARLKEKSLHK